MLISTDASIIEIEPKEVIYPTNRDDLVNIIRSLLSKNHILKFIIGESKQKSVGLLKKNKNLPIKKVTGECEK